MAILSIGHVGNAAAEAISNVEANSSATIAHYDLRFAKPLVEELLHEVGKRFKGVITIENGALRGGVGEAIVSFLNENGYDTKVTKLGIDDNFIEHGTLEELHAICGFDTKSIEQTIKDILR